MGILRNAGKVAAVVVGLAVVAIGALYAQTQWTLTRPAVAPTRDKLVVTPDSALLARGARLVSINGCNDCHASDMGGKVMVDEAVFGRFAPTNLTTGEGGVLARYDDAALDAAIRDGVGWDGRKLIFMPSHEFAALADNDVAAMIAHMRTVAPVNRTVPPTRLGPIARGLLAADKMVLLPNDVVDHGRATRKAAPAGGNVEQGRYLAAGCTGCHATDFGGRPVPGAPKGAKPSANITPSGNIGRWTQAEFVTAIREGRRPDGSVLEPTMPWRAIGQLNDEELQAIYLYLKTLPPKAVQSQ